MKAGVLFWNHGRRCLPRLAVAVHSLRKHYEGPVCLLNEGELDDWALELMLAYCVEVRTLPVCNEYGLVKKSRLWRHTPFQRTLFLDSDVLVLGDPSELLRELGPAPLLVTRFADWGTSSGRMKARIMEWNRVDPTMAAKALSYGAAINTGVMGWTSGCRSMEQYEQLTARGLAARVGRKTLDELAMQLVAASGAKHTLASSDWNCSCVYGDLSRAKVVHYHGHKHCRSGPAGDLWKLAAMDVARAHPEAARHITGRDCPDASVLAWMEQEGRPPGYRRDLTVVTAVNPAYAERAARNFEVWARTPGLKEQDFLVFVNGFQSAKARKFAEALPHCKVVRWEYRPEAGARETMLASFVEGVARHVRTPYWMKLDADTTPKGPFVWPDYRGACVVSHRWGYTKVKHDPMATEHWINTLDKFSGGEPMLKRTVDPRVEPRLSHRAGNPDGLQMRFASFAHIERTSHTRRLAGLVMAHGRMPVPSQDTLSWYFATKWGERVKLVNMKEWFQP